MKMTLEEMDALAAEVEKAVREVAKDCNGISGNDFVTGGLFAIEIMKAAILREITTEVSDE